jgi:hypothetical protein
MFNYRLVQGGSEREFVPLQNSTDESYITFSVLYI